MTRKCAWIGFPYLFGLIAAGLFKADSGYILILMAVGLTVVCFAQMKKYRSYVITCGITFILGVCTSCLYTHFVYDKLMAYDGKTVTVQGYVTDFDYIGSDTVRLTVHCKIKDTGTDISCYVSDDDYRYYDKITMKVTLAALEDSINFQSREYYYSKSVFLTGKKAEILSHSDECEKLLFRGIKEYRDRLKAQLSSAVSGDEKAFLEAMLLGDKSEMSQRLKTQMYRSGIGHIFAVSGTHLVIVTSMLSALLSLFIRNKRTRGLIIILEVWGFAVFAGLSVSLVRAAVMFTVMEIGNLIERDSDCANSLGLSAVLLTVRKPYTAIAPSFLLSFGAVFALGVIAPNIVKRLPQKLKFRPVWEYVICSVCVLFFTAPVCVMLFGGVSVASVLSNLLLVPLCTVALLFAFVPVLLGGVGFVAKPAFTLAALIIKPVLKCSALIANIPYGYITASNSAVAVTVAITALVPILLFFVGRSVKRFAALSCGVVCLWMTLANAVRIINTDPVATILPNGSTSAYVIGYGNKAIIFDMGCKGSLNRGIERLLCDRGLNTTECMFISKEAEYTSIRANNDFSSPPEIYFTFNEISADNDCRIYVNSTVNISGMNITATDNGYTVEYDGFCLELSPNAFTVNEDVYDITKEEYPMEITLGKSQVRRLDYGFD